MKRQKNSVILTLLFVTCYLLCGCSDISDNVTPNVNAVGRVAVTINGAAARTVFPTMAFAKYEYLFAKVTNGTPGTPQAQAPVGGFFTLELGNWQLTVRAYAKADDTSPAATGTSATFTVTGSGVAQAAVHLNGNAATGEGKFVYTITYPAGTTISVFSLKNLQNDAVININISGARPLSGSAVVDAGYYFLTIQLTEGAGGRTTGANEVVYIYDKLDSAYNKTFSANDFSHIHDWSSWTQTTAPTCMAAGWDTRTCTLNAAHTDTRIGKPIDPNAHNYGNWITTAPTCTTAGWDTRTCSHNAAHTETRAETAINPNAHDWNTSYTTITAATVTTDGIEAITCKHNSSHTKEPRTAYATGTTGLSFTLISDNTAYRVSRGTATGTIHIPAYRLYNGNYLPVTEIGNGTNSSSSNAFGGTSPQTTITSITFAAESQLTSIADYAFQYCTALTSINIPASVTSIGQWAFSICRSLTSITLPESVTSIGDGVFSSCFNLTSVTIPASVTSIGDYAFATCRSLTSITIPASVTSIGVDAFYDCNGLTSITIPASVTTIGELAFYSCTSLTSITVDANNSNFTSQDGILYNKAKTTLIQSPPAGISGSVTISEEVTSISKAAFYRCTNLTSITIPTGVTSIGNSAFSGCTSLTSINIPAGVTSIGDYAFTDCTSLTNINIPAGVASIGNRTFSSCRSLTSINIPASVTSIGESAFYGCTGLTSVTFTAGSQLQTIDPRAFQSCTSLTSITIPANVTSIGTYAFSGCTNLTSVICLPTTPPLLWADGPFGNNANLTIKVPSSSVNTYKNVVEWGWSGYASQISAI